MTDKTPKRVFDFYQLEDHILLSGEGFSTERICPTRILSSPLG